MGFFIVLVIIFTVILILPRKKKNKPQTGYDEKSDIYENTLLDNYRINTESGETGLKKSDKETMRQPQIHRKGEHPNNMNCDRYKFSGRFKETKRIRRNNYAYVFAGDNPKDVIMSMGYEEPIEYSLCEWEPMTEAQREYLKDLTNGKYQDGLCINDASGLIDRYTMHTFNANPFLFKYAEEMKIPASYYYPEERLVGTIFSHLQGADKIAFFAYMTYCRNKRLELGNLLNSPYKDVFVNFGKKMMENGDYDFLKYLNDNFEFGLWNKKGHKMALNYLRDAGIIDK